MFPNIIWNRDCCRKHFAQWKRLGPVLPSLGRKWSSMERKWLSRQLCDRKLFHVSLYW
ncbi:hypothetical protein DPMN_145275 [Dreissena polymorpha]|uniref:Uncharacterized protein n=1 Tax=Dreissena polymorpha TaxID=45954 RepID=A0A9D4F3P1_DREPO|nr:hypothetical protein DPMN_145275 [Dreissena polymorpha]